MTTRVITLWREHVTSLTMPVSIMRFLIKIMFILKAIKSHMIIRILHEWSFYLKFMKLAEGSFHKFHMVWYDIDTVTGPLNDVES